MGVSLDLLFQTEFCIAVFTEESLAYNVYFQLFHFHSVDDMGDVISSCRDWRGTILVDW